MVVVLTLLRNPAGTLAVLPYSVMQQIHQLQY